MSVPPAPGRESCPVERFGQGTDHTCAVSCLRYLRWHYEGNVFEENDLVPAVLPHRRSGHLVSDVARALDRLGYRTHVRYLAGGRRTLGRGAPPSTQVEAGSDTDLRNWLVGTVRECGPVLVGIDTRRLGPPYVQARGGPHCVVVLVAQQDEVEFLEPDPPQQSAYPKTGARMTVPAGPFLSAWAAVWYLALRAWPA
jgi:hypothetical protein